MIGTDESAPDVFTKSGQKWLTDLLDALRERNYRESAEIGSHNSWSNINKNDGVVPTRHPEYGQIIQDPNPPQYLLFRDTNHIDPLNLKKEYRNYSKTHFVYHADNFGQVRIYQEAVARDMDEYFVPITGWDGEHFNWLTMPVLSDYHRSDGGSNESAEVTRELKNEDNNWVIHDQEDGIYNGRRVLSDYDMCWYDGSWKVSESQIMDPGFSVSEN